MTRRVFGSTTPSCSLVLRPPTSHVEPIRGSNSTVPESRILYRPLLVAKIRIDQSIALGITLRPLEVVDKCPCMEGANLSSIGDRASQLRHFCERVYRAICTLPLANAASAARLARSIVQSPHSGNDLRSRAYQSPGSQATRKLMGLAQRTDTPNQHGVRGQVWVITDNKAQRTSSKKSIGLRLHPPLPKPV